MGRTFVIPDLHGHSPALRSLIAQAAEEQWEGDNVVSIGDLANAVQESGDEDAANLQMAQELDWTLILGNHESGYIFEDMGFGGYYEIPEVKHLYRSLFNQGRVVPAVLVGQTLLTHAGVHKYFDFDDAQQAYDAIVDVWENYARYAADPLAEQFNFPSGISVPKCMLLDGVAGTRGGADPFGGILWSDWSEPKNQNFSQVVGHTPMRNGPVINTYVNYNGFENSMLDSIIKGSSGPKDRVFHMNIDASAKSGAVPVGVWLDDEGNHIGFVQAKVSLEVT